MNYDSFNLNLTLLLLTGVVLGGAGRLWGPLVGLTPLLVLSFWIGPFSQYNAVVLGLGLLAGVLAFPDGLLPAIERMAGNRLPGLFVRSEIVGGAQARTPVRRSKPPARRTRRDVQADVLLRVRGLRKRFGGLQVLAGVEFDLYRGRLCGLVGPNGSGKSTFLNTLSGFVRPDEGSILLGTVDVAQLAPHQIAAKGIGRTFQVPQLIDELSALENIELGLLAREPMPVLASMLSTPGVRKRAAARRETALAALARVGLPASAVSDPVEQLPLGLKRTVEVARAIASNPHVVLLDEPAAGLSDVERRELGALLRTLVDDGITVLVVEHNVSFILSICDEVVLLENGRISVRADLRDQLPDSLARYLSILPATRSEQAVP